MEQVWQMTSDVTARTRPGTTLTDVFAALFPCGSITGAPKVRAMQMIHAIESAPRGVDCGAVGVVRPLGAAGADGQHRVAATFNVPIRTVVLRTDGGHTQATCGIGSGITSGSQADAEWNEWRHQRAFVERASQPFDLLETLALVDAQWRHLARHGVRHDPDGAGLRLHYDPALAVPFREGFDADVDLWALWDMISCPVLLLGMGSRKDA